MSTVSPALDTAELSTWCQEFFALLWVHIESTEIDIEAEDIYRLTLKTDDSHLLIGTHGATLLSIQGLLSRLIERRFSTHITLHFEVNDYLQQKHMRLESLLRSHARRACDSDQVVRLEHLSPYERKLAHDLFHREQLGVESYSEGEGSQRVLCIRPSSSQRSSALLATITEEGAGI